MANLIRRISNISRYPTIFASRCISTTMNRPGIEEFFPPGVYEGKNHVDENPVVGRRWKLPELRIRSNTDLHKFWYVLLKERNMLMTLEHECKRLGIIVPAPTRLHKVKKTMELVERVIKEREKAIMDLEKERKYKFDMVDGTVDTVTDDEVVDNFESRKEDQPGENVKTAGL